MFFDSIADCARDLSIPASKISDIIAGRCKSAYGYTFTDILSLSGDDFELYVKKAKLGSRRLIISYFADTKEVYKIYDSQVEAAKDLGIRQQYISQSIIKKTTTTGPNNRRLAWSKRGDDLSILETDFHQ